jgi:hypothetical protein
MLLNLLGTANDWERFLVTYPQDHLCHATGIDAWTAMTILSTLAAWTLSRLNRRK